MTTVVMHVFNISKYVVSSLTVLSDSLDLIAIYCNV